MRVPIHQIEIGQLVGHRLRVYVDYQVCIRIVARRSHHQVLRPKAAAEFEPAMPVAAHDELNVVAIFSSPAGGDRSQRAPSARATLRARRAGRRKAEKAVVLTTNLPFSEWTQAFPNARLCKELLDPITDRAHILETGTESYRFRRTADKHKKGAKPS